MDKVSEAREKLKNCKRQDETAITLSKNNIKISASKSQLKLITIIVAIIMLFLLAVVIEQKIKYSSFEKANAEIVEIFSKSGTSSSTNMTYSHFVRYEYDINGTRHTGTKQFFFKSSKRLGNLETIRYNPDNPEEIENTFLANSLISVSIFFGVILLFLIAMMKQNNNRYR